MDVRALLIELFERVDDHVDQAVEGLDSDQLCWSPAPGANSIGWLIWHLTRIEDHHVAELVDADQIWMSGDWAALVGLEPDPTNTGYGHEPEDVASVRPASPEALVGYYRAVSQRTRSFISEVTPDDLDRVVDERWDPPVTMGVRLVSVVDDLIQHSGQARYVRGLLPLLAWPS